MIGSGSRLVPRTRRKLDCLLEELLRPSAIRLKGRVQERTDHRSSYRQLTSKNNFLAWTNKTKDRGQSDYGDVAFSFPTEGTMRAPIPTPEGLPAQAAIIIIGCLFVFLAALWLFVITKAMIAIGIGAVALFTAGACAFAHRYALKPL